MRRVSSTILWKPGSSADSPQPASFVGAACASSTRQEAAAWRDFTISGVTRPIASCVKVNCSTGLPDASTVTARTSMPLAVSAYSR